MRIREHIVTITAAWMHSGWMSWAGTLLEEEPGLSDEICSQWISKLTFFDKLPFEEQEKYRSLARTLLQQIVDEGGIIDKDEGKIPDYYCQVCGMQPGQCLCSHDD